MNNHNCKMLTVVALILMIACSQLSAHCQIPCGIYDDETQFTLMLEDVATIEKSMDQITTLGKEEKPNYNQLVRWINNKEAHADKLAEIITYYFMAQRIKEDSKENTSAYQKYIKEITLLHQMLILTMKAKQTTDLENCSSLRKLILEFKTSYMQH